MTLHRFFVPSNILHKGAVHLTGAPYDQIRRVLRMRVGDEVALFDGSGSEYLVRLVEFGKAEVVGHILSESALLTEPAHRVDLYLSLLNKPDKFEWALQKCTELGVSRFIPVVAARSVTDTARAERWERIIQEAAEQSGRGALPELGGVMPLWYAFQEAASGSTGYKPHSRLALMPEVSGDISLKDAIRGSEAHTAVEQVSLFIGPEGGFTAEEQSLASESGVRVVRMGSRVLRAETAAVVAVTLTMSLFGELT